MYNIYSIADPFIQKGLSHACYRAYHSLETCAGAAFCGAWPGMAELEDWKLGDGIPTVGKAGERHRQKLVALKKSINASKPYQVRLGAAWAGVRGLPKGNENPGGHDLKGWGYKNRSFNQELAELV